MRRGRDVSGGSGDGVPGLDITVANPARVWNYWVGGKDNFAVDREAAEQVVAVMPSMPLLAKAGRRFLVDAVHELADRQGIRQFLDIGTGLPTAGNTHEIAQQVAPESRIVYVDHDPVVISHAQALLTSSPQGRRISFRRTCATRRPSWPAQRQPWTLPGRSACC